MSILQKRAWTHFAIVTGVVIIGIIFIKVLVHVNYEGGAFISVFSILVGITVGFISYIRSLQKEQQLDEREKMITRKSFEWSSKSFVLFMALTSMIIFEISGTRNNVPVYLLPLLVLAGIFIAQLVESATILIWCAKEQQDG